MAEEHRVSGEHGACSASQIYKDEVAAFIALHESMGILESVEHTAANHRNQPVLSDLCITHYGACSEIVDHRYFTTRQHPSKYAGITAEGVVDRGSVRTQRNR